MPETEPKATPARDPRALSTEYHKARKQLMLWAAILFIWELVGIDLDKAKEAGGNAGAIIGAIKSPRAVPWALLILVLYFSFKLRVEWRQCNETRRRVREAKQDYYSAFTVAGAACALYFYQAISRVQLADRLPSGGSGLNELMLLLVVNYTLGVQFLLAVRRWRSTKEHIHWLKTIEFVFAIASVVAATILSKISRLSWPITLSLAGISFVLFSADFFLIRHRPGTLPKN
jgi:hypothetical protein